MSHKKNRKEREIIQLKENMTKKNDLKLSDLPSDILNWLGEQSHEIVAVWNKHGKLLFISQSVEAILGFQPEKLIGMRWDSFLTTEDKQSFNQEALKKEEKQTFNIKIENVEEKYIWFECNLSKIYIAKHKNKYCYVSILKDITNKKEAEEMMILSEKMSVAGQLAAGIAHEIRNPLTSLKGFLQLMKAGVDAQDAYYKIMIDEINKIETITSELLLISKPMTNNKKSESVQSMINDVLVLLQPQARLHHIHLKWANEHDAYVYCDRSQIKQALINIVKNAIEAVHSDATITINVKTRNHFIEIDVIDEGPGIPEDIIHKISEPFFTTKPSGTGLGLMITKQILEQHNGYMDILPNKNRGSTFRMLLPKYEF